MVRPGLPRPEGHLRLIARHGLRGVGRVGSRANTGPTRLRPHQPRLRPFRYPDWARLDTESPGVASRRSMRLVRPWRVSETERTRQLRADETRTEREKPIHREQYPGAGRARSGP